MPGEDDEDDDEARTRRFGCGQRPLRIPGRGGDFLIAPHPMLGVGLHAVGAFLSPTATRRKNCQALVLGNLLDDPGGVVLLLWPIIGAVATIPQLAQVWPRRRRTGCLYSFLMGVAYG